DESGIAAESAAKQLASRIAAGDAPSSLRDVSIVKLETSILFSNFSNRKAAGEAATSILDAAIASSGSQILYIDDLASIADLGDAGSKLITAARDGQIRVIGGNSPAAYAKFLAAHPEAAEIFTQIDLNAAADNKPKVQNEYRGDNVAPDIRRMLADDPSGTKRIDAIVQAKNVSDP